LKAKSHFIKVVEVTTMTTAHEGKFYVWPDGLTQNTAYWTTNHSLSGAVLTTKIIAKFSIRITGHDAVRDKKAFNYH
jgi:hypothetical protein